MRIAARLLGAAACLCYGVVVVVQAEVMRPYNLDYFDVDTLRYYLQAPETAASHEYDVAVLYYAQWCKNCHAFAPIWDKMSRLLHAGKRQDSKLIMGLFDCEKDATHMQVCNEANVKHYPTITFYSLASGHTFHAKQRKSKRNPYPIPPHGVQFKGNWQYGDAVYDWLRSMSGLAAWHRAGWGRKLRSLFFGGGGEAKKKKSQPLPLGIPSGGATTTATATKSSSSESWFSDPAKAKPPSVDASSGSAYSGSSGAASAAASTGKVAELEAKVKNMEEVTLRSSVMMGSMMHPATIRKDVSARVAANASLVPTTLRHDNGKNYTDAFHLLNVTDAWAVTATTTTTNNNKKKAKDTDSFLIQNEDLVLRSCVMEIALDYCTRVTTQVTLDWLDEHETNLTDAALDALEDDLLRGVERLEPYCVLVESCIRADMANPECRPPTCPFVDPVGCRYVSSCLEPELQGDYAKVLEVETSTTKAQKAKKATLDSADATKTTTTSSSDGGAEPQKKGGGGWGLF